MYSSCPAAAQTNCVSLTSVRSQHKLVFPDLLDEYVVGQLVKGVLVVCSRGKLNAQVIPCWFGVLPARRGTPEVEAVLHQQFVFISLYVVDLCLHCCESQVICQTVLVYHTVCRLTWEVSPCMPREAASSAILPRWLCSFDEGLLQHLITLLDMMHLRTSSPMARIAHTGGAVAILLGL